MRLRATADALDGNLACGPDLANHLPALAQQNPGVDCLHISSSTLRRYAGEIGAGSTSRESLAWLEAVRPYLQLIEAEITLSLEGLTSFDQAVRTYWGQMSYLDQHLGALVEGLRSLGLYDSSTLVFTSPHGEGLGERGITFQHHALLESCLRVPLIVKPSLAQRAASARDPGPVSGTVSLLDLPATILEASDVPAVNRIDSRSIWLDLLGAGPLPIRDAYALGVYGTQAALVRGNRKLIHAFSDHWFSESWNFRQGETRLIDLSDPDPDGTDSSRDEPELVRAMQERLLAWAADIGATEAESGRRRSGAPSGHSDG